MFLFIFRVGSCSRYGYERDTAVRGFPAKDAVNNCATRCDFPLRGGSQ